MKSGHDVTTARPPSFSSWTSREYADCRSLLLVAGLFLLPWCGASAAVHTDDGRCSAILDRSDRLDCFDRQDSGPRHAPRVPERLPDASPATVDVIPVVLHQETGRARDEYGFLLPREPAGVEDETRLLIASTPSIPPSLPGSYLVMSCVSNISRIQIIVRRPMVRSRATVRFMAGTATRGPASAWRALDGRRIVDGGRGLPAIERIRSLGEGGRLYIASDSPELDGLLFDMTGVKQVVARLRKACHW